MKTTQNQVDKIKDLYLNNTKTKEISEIVKVNIHTVNSYIKKLGIRRTISGAKRKFTIDEDLFKNINEPWKAYFLGWMYSDGNVYIKSKRYTVSLCLAEKDKCILNYFNEKIYDNNRKLNFRKSRYKKDTNYLCSSLYRLTIDSKIICDDLILNGVVPNKSKIIKAPLLLNQNLFPYFIQGVFEGDGNISKNRTENNRVVRIFSASYDFIFWLKNILETNYNIYFNIRKKEKLFVLTSSRKEEILKFKNLIYENCTFKLERKYERFNY